MRWYDEIPRLFRHPIDEIGVVFFVREKMGNDWLATHEDLRITFGQGWARTVENLRRDGILKCTYGSGAMRLQVVSAGDLKRKRCREIGMKKRLGKCKDMQKREKREKSARGIPQGCVVYHKKCDNFTKTTERKAN